MRAFLMYVNTQIDEVRQAHTPQSLHSGAVSSQWQSLHSGAGLDRADSPTVFSQSHPGGYRAVEGVGIFYHLLMPSELHKLQRSDSRQPGSRRR